MSEPVSDRTRQIFMLMVIAIAVLLAAIVIVAMVTDHMRVVEGIGGVLGGLAITAALLACFTAIGSKAKR